MDVRYGYRNMWAIKVSKTKINYCEKWVIVIQIEAENKINNRQPTHWSTKRPWGNDQCQLKCDCLGVAEPKWVKKLMNIIFIYSIIMTHFIDCYSSLESEASKIKTSTSFSEGNEKYNKHYWV